MPDSMQQEVQSTATATQVKGLAPTFGETRGAAGVHDDSDVAWFWFGCRCPYCKQRQHFYPSAGCTENALLAHHDYSKQNQHCTHLVDVLKMHC